MSPCRIHKIVVDDNIPVFLVAKLLTFTYINAVDKFKQHFTVKREAVAKETGTSSGTDGTTPKKAPEKVGKKVGPNDPCPCGSGKKYKKCCGDPARNNQ